LKTDSVLSRKVTLPKTARTRARRPATAAQAKIEFDIDNKSRIYIFCSGKGHIAMDCPSSQRDLDRWQVRPLLDFILFTLRVRKRNDEDKVKGMDLEDL